MTYVSQTHLTYEVLPSESESSPCDQQYGQIDLESNSLLGNIQLLSPLNQLPCRFLRGATLRNLLRLLDHPAVVDPDPPERKDDEGQRMLTKYHSCFYRPER